MVVSIPEKRCIKKRILSITIGSLLGGGYYLKKINAVNFSVREFRGFGRFLAENRPFFPQNVFLHENMSVEVIWAGGVPMHYSKAAAAALE